MATKPPVDWDQVAIDIRAGILTDRQIGAKHGRSHGAIQQYAKKHGIERNLTGRIQQRTSEKLAKAVLANQTSQDKARFTQDQTIELAAEVAATIVIKQQGRIGRHIALSEKMLDELESVTDSKDLFEQLGELLQAPDEKGQDKRAELYRRVIDMPSRVDSLKKLVETFKTLVALERQAFGIKDEAADTPTDGIRRLLKEIDGSTASLLPD